MSLRAVDVAGTAEADERWSGLAAAAPQAWCWHTLRWRDFVRSASSGRNVTDQSFFVFDGDRPVGLAPFTVGDFNEGGAPIRDAAYNGGPLPWPAIVGGAGDSSAAAAERFAFEEAERRARSLGAERIRFASFAPEAAASAGVWFDRVTHELAYLDASFPSHLVNVDAEVLSRVRKRYAQYIRRFRAAFACEVIDGAAVDDAFEQRYFELHVKDAGGQFRPRDSYSRMADLARHAEGFFVTARDLETGAVAGMLLVSVVKGAAFDTSVAVDPEFADRFVSHLLKHRAILHLQQLGVTHYELGMSQLGATLEWVPTPKTRGISFFKAGWARDGVKRIYVAEKFLTREGLEKHIRSRLHALEAFYGFSQ
jgi:hypothetical protein